MASKALLTAGYIKIVEKTYKLMIPNEIKFIISKYIKIYSIFGIGDNGSGLMAVNHLNDISKWHQ